MYKKIIDVIKVDYKDPVSETIEQLISTITSGGDVRAFANTIEDKNVLYVAFTTSRVKEALKAHVEKGGRIYHLENQTGANFKTDTALFLQALQVIAYRIAFEHGHAPSNLTVAPSAALVPWAAAMLSGTGIQVIAQDFKAPGCPALTGEMTGSALTLKQLKELGIHTAIIMHSELRLEYRANALRSNGYNIQQARELENMITAAKVDQAVAAGIGAKVCLGEHHFERFLGGRFEGEKYLSKHIDGNENLSAVRDIIEAQLFNAFWHISEERMMGHLLSGRLMEVANEPIWAISGFGGNGATNEQAEYVNKLITLWLIEKFGALAALIPVTYGGSVKPSTAAGLIQLPTNSGSLVGSASFDEQVKALYKDLYSNASIVDLMRMSMAYEVLSPSRLYGEVYAKLDAEFGKKGIVPSIFQIADQNNGTVR